MSDRYVRLKVGEWSSLSNLASRKLGRLVRLTDEDQQLLETHTSKRAVLDAHSKLISEGENPNCVNLILDGWAYRYKVLEDGRRQIISFFLPGDMCDPMVFLLHRMGHCLECLTDVTVARISYDDMKVLMDESASLTRAFWLDMIISAEIQREWTISLGRKTATERMAHLFCEVGLRLKFVGLSNGRGYDMPLTQADLADALGLSTVHVNRTLQDLRAAGLIELRARRLRILDEQSLQGLAMFDPTYLHPMAESNA